MVLEHFRKKAQAKKLRKGDVPSVFLESFEEAVSLDVKKPVREAEFVVIDTETTGLEPEKGDMLLSIAGVGFTNGRVDLSRSFYELMNPGREIPPESVIVHNLTPDQLEGLPTAAEVLIRFFRFCKGAILVGHHSAFDARCIDITLKENFGITSVNRILDTAAIARSIDEMEDAARFFMEEREHIGLDVLAERFGIKMPDRHDAYGDAFATALIFQRQFGILRAKGMDKVKDLIQLGAVR